MYSSRNVLTTVTSDASLAWKLLNGIFIAYKPAGLNVLAVKDTITRRLCDDLNEMEIRPPTNYVSIEGETNKQMRVNVQPNYADHPLVVGPRYQPRDIKLSWVNYLSKDASGVLIAGINGGNKFTARIRDTRPTRVYKVKGIFGQATDNYFITGKIMERSTFRHVKRVIIDKICASMQSSHQRKMFELSGVDMQTQAAYDLAVKGLIRPANPNIPMLYSIKCLEYTPPEFILEVVCINEEEMYLKTLVHDLGMTLHTTATCTQLQCVRYGLFTITDALLSKHWDLESILHSMRRCDEILNDNEYLLQQESASLIDGGETS